MARTTTSSRILVQDDYDYSLRFLDDRNRQITCNGAANYTTDIIGNYTILIFCDLEAVPNSSVTVHSLISNNAATVSTNMLLTVDKFTRKVNNRITDGAGSQTFTSTGRVPYGWGWVGESYQAGVQLRTIIGTSIETTAPTITAVANAGRTLAVGSTNANTWIRGNVARVWIFGGQISQAELNDVVYKGLIPPSLTKALIWNMTDGSGTQITDSSGNANHGAISGATAPDWSSTVPYIARSTTGSRSVVTTNRDVI